MAAVSVQHSAGKHLSDIYIAMILALDKVSISQWQIAALIKTSRTAVQHTLQTYTFETFQELNQRGEYRRKTTRCEDRYIERALKQNDSIPLCDITNIVRERGLPVLEATVWRRRSEPGLCSYVAAKKPGLRIENIAKTLQWARQYKDWTVDNWKCVIWSDESSIWIRVNSRRQFVISPAAEKYNPKVCKEDIQERTD